MANDLNELEPAWRVVTETLDLTNRQQGQRGLAILTNPLFSGVRNVVLPWMRGSQVLTGIRSGCRRIIRWRF